MNSNYNPTNYQNESTNRNTRLYSPNEGFKYEWCKDFQIKTSFERNVFVIKANKEGLISLAKQLLQLAQDDVPNGYHLHYDEFNSLENDSPDFVIEKG